MNLETFNSLAITTEKEACAITASLIKILNKNETSEKLILTYFESIPFEFKQNKELNEGLFSSFFTTYQVNENNISYYNKYIQDSAIKLIIIEKNPHWKWEQTVFEYNTLKELLNNFHLAKSVSKNPNKYNSDGLKFIEENHNSFLKFSKASPKKFEQSLIKNDVFKFLQEINYTTFTDFCEKHSLNHVNILKNMYTKPYSEYYEGYGFAEYIRTLVYKKSSHSDFVNILNDITVNSDKFFGDNNQFLNLRKGTTDCANHVSFVFMELILEKRYDLANTLVQHFKNEIITGLLSLDYKLRNTDYIPNEITHHMMEDARKTLYKAGDFNGTFHKFRGLENKQIGQFENYYNTQKSAANTVKPKLK